MAFVEDLSDFINPYTPGYLLASVGGVDVPALFDNEYAEFEMASGCTPALTVDIANVPGVDIGDAVSVNAISYTVSRIKPDGTGIVVLILEAV